MAGMEAEKLINAQPLNRGTIMGMMTGGGMGIGMLLNVVFWILLVAGIVVVLVWVVQKNRKQ